MEAVTRYRSGGRDFATEAEALNHDRLLRIVEAINAILGPSQGIDPNGGNYKQHTARDVGSFDNAFCAALMSEFPNERHAAYTRGFIGRILDDCSHPFRSLYYRLACIDEQNREWGQIYYANNPNPEAKPTDQPTAMRHPLSCPESQAVVAQDDSLMIVNQDPGDQQ